MKKVFITGGTTGIGLAVAQQYMAMGYKVGVCGRDVSKLNGYGENDPNFFAYQADVADKDGLQSQIKKFIEQAGGLDIIIANAGISVGSKNKLPNFEASRQVITTNVLGVLNTFEPAVEYMLQNGGGQLAAVSSVAGFVGLPGASSYSASKAAVTTLCESYAIDLKERGITTTAICPGFIKTPLTDKNDHSMPFIMSVEKAAQKIVKGLEKKKEQLVFPWQMRIVISILDKMPRCCYRKLMRVKLLNYSKE